MIVMEVDMCVGPNNFWQKNLGFVIINGPHCVSSVVLTSIFLPCSKYTQKKMYRHGLNIINITHVPSGQMKNIQFGSLCHQCDKNCWSNKKVLLYNVVFLMPDVCQKQRCRKKIVNGPKIHNGKRISMNKINSSQKQSSHKFFPR